MTKFFDSNLIKNEIDSIHELQLECFENAFAFDTMSHEDQKEHVDNLLTLLDKQKVMYARLCLTDDPEAKKTKKHLENSVSLLGFPKGTSMQSLFDKMEKTIANLREKMDDK
jgi:agmatine/peptidylarginine deiminase